MKIGDQVQFLIGYPGPDLHIGIVRAIGEKVTVYDACCMFEIDLPREWLKPITAEARATTIQYGYGSTKIREGVYTFGELLDRASGQTGGG